MPQYQGVWTLEQQAQAQSNQQWVTDPNFKNTTLLLQADGTGSGSQNNTFLDGSTNNFFITRNGNTTQGSFSPFSQAPGYWGSYLSIGNNPYIVANSAFSFTGDFTIEFFVNLQTTSGSSPSYILQPLAGSTYFAINIIAGTGFDIFLNTSGSALSVRDRIPSVGVWCHVALVRSGSTVKLYMDGIASATTAITSSTLGSSTVNFDIGNGNVPACYMSNVRVVKGSAVYTANFTPPTSPLTAITNTVLLTLQSNRFVDNSSSPLTFGFTGTPSIQAFGPFAPALQWTPDVVGGSGYFDGSGDYLNFLDTTQSGATSNFDMGGIQASWDFWAYITTTSSSIAFAKTANAVSSWNDIQYIFYPYESGNSTFFFRNGANYALVQGTFPAKLNSWAHFVVSTDASNNISIYVNGTRLATTNNTIGKPSTANYIGIGSQSGATGGGVMNGYVSGMRFIRGSGAFSATTSTITVPTAPPTAVSGTQLLLNYTNAGIYDGAMKSVFETVTDAKVATSPVKYGSGSISYVTTTSTGAYLAANQNTSLYALYTGDFTVEGWIWLTTTAFDYSGPGPIFNYGNGGANGPLGYYTCWAWNLINGGTGFTFYRFDGTETSYTFSGTIPVNQWVHVALTRANGYMRAFVNGTQIGSATAVSLNYAPISGTNRMLIGIGSGGGGANQYYRFPGYMDDLRITQGVARYIANFTPPQQALPRQ